MPQKHLEKYRKKSDSQKESDRKQEGLLFLITVLLYVCDNRNEVISSGIGATNFMVLPVIGWGKLMR